MGTITLQKASVNFYSPKMERKQVNLFYLSLSSSSGEGLSSELSFREKELGTSG